MTYSPPSRYLTLTYSGPMDYANTMQRTKSNNNTISDETDYETCYKTNIYISMFLDHHICVKLKLIECTIRLSLLRRELRVDKLITARQRSAFLLQCYLILERAEDSHSVFGN